MSKIFRATTLWNEVIQDFQTHMRVKRHRYKLTSHDNTFTGKEASQFLFSHLRQNTLFGPDITQQQIDMLLDKFLKTGLFQSVSENGGNIFRPNKKLYRFTRRIPLRQVQLPMASHANINTTHVKTPMKYKGEINYSCTELNEIAQTKNFKTTAKPLDQPRFVVQEVNDLYRLIWASKEIWKSKVVLRIKELVGLYIDIDAMINVSDVPPIWPSINASSVQSGTVRKTNLPPWVNESLNTLAFNDLLRETSETYEGYYKDVASVLCDYINNLKRPLCATLKNLLIKTYNYLDELDTAQKSALMASERNDMLWVTKTPQKRPHSLENRDNQDAVVQEAQEYLWSMTSPKKLVDEQIGTEENAISKVSLPKGLCYETAFTSDEPVTRIVPKSNTDTLTLKALDRKSNECKQFDANGCKQFDDSKFLFDRWIFDSSNNYVHAPSRFNGNFANSDDSVSDLAELESVHLSDVFEQRIPENYSDTLKNFQERPEKSLYPSIERPYHLEIRSKNIAYKQSHNYQNDIDYRQAIDSVERLIDFSVSSINHHHHQASQDCASSEQSTVMDSNSLYSYSACSSDQSSEYDQVTTDSQRRRPKASRNWETQVKYIGAHLFRLELLLLPPSKKVRLDITLFLIEILSKAEKKFRNQLSLKLMHKILPPEEGEDYRVIQSFIEFLVENRREVTKPFDIDQICGETEVSFIQELENVRTKQFGTESFCSKISNELFEVQKLTGSEAALAELLDQILSDQKMLEKEKRKRLKQFQDAYPHIYARRFPHHATQRSARSALPYNHCSVSNRQIRC